MTISSPFLTSLLSILSSSHMALGGPLLAAQCMDWRGRGGAKQRHVDCTVTEAVRRRARSRAFLDRPVERSDRGDAGDLAARAPSGGNLQPWRVDVLTGDALAELKARVRGQPRRQSDGRAMELKVYPSPLPEP